MLSYIEKAGLNPILAVTGGGVSTGVPGGATASVGGSAMSAANSAQTSGGLLGANAASEGNYSGQMEQMGTTLALLGAIFAGISSAADAANGLGPVGEQVIDTITDELTTKFKDMPNSVKKALSGDREAGSKIGDTINSISNPVYSLYSTGKKAYNYYKKNSSREFQFRVGHAKG